MKKKKIISALVIITAVVVFYISKSNSLYYEIGERIDSFNGVDVYYNGEKISESHGRNLADGGYNLGQKWQCVEYIKRYYYEYFNHEMPDSYGHAKDFFDASISDGGLNKSRNLLQFTNPSFSKPRVNDIIVMSGGYGHVGIVTEVTDDRVEMIQQNVGPVTRATFILIHEDGKWKIDSMRVSGWLRIR